MYYMKVDSGNWSVENKPCREFSAFVSWGSWMNPWLSRPFSHHECFWPALYFAPYMELSSIQLEVFQMSGKNGWPLLPKWPTMFDLHLNPLGDWCHSRWLPPGVDTKGGLDAFVAIRVLIRKSMDTWWHLCWCPPDHCWSICFDNQFALTDWPPITLGFCVLSVLT